MQMDDEIQYAPRSRPVSLYDNFEDSSAIPLRTATAVSVGNLTRIRESNSNSRMIRSNDSDDDDTGKNNNNDDDNAYRDRSRTTGSTSPCSLSKIRYAKAKGGVSAENVGRIDRQDKEKGLGRAPSMANCLSTTVPVNLAASQIAGRHTPTRNSLRHSRMIVLHRSGYAGAQKFLPPLVYRHRLARCLAALQIILGIAVTSLALWLLLWAPNLPAADNPYWSGMPLLFSGSFGVCLLCCFKKEYPGMNPGFCLSTTKIISILLAIVACATSATACIVSLMHLARLMVSECAPARVLNATCVCRPRDDNGGVAMTMANGNTSTEGTTRYVDLKCPEVESILTMLLIFSVACNALGAVVAGWYSYLHWSTRNKRPEYIKVRTFPRRIHDTSLNNR